MLWGCLFAGRRLVWMAIALVSVVGSAQTYVPGDTYYDRSNYIQYIPGDLPVIISAPHGGALTPAEIPDRQDDGSDPDFTTVTDSNTSETAYALQGVFGQYFGHIPHIVVCRLKRTKIDCNRSLSQGVYQSNPYATIAWNDFQNWIDVASNSAVAQNGLGFYIDQHGQGHAIERLELGYLLTAQQLMNADDVLDGSRYPPQSSIRTLAGIVNRKFGMSFSQILRGTNSFGGLMEARGFPSVPDPDMPSPGNGTNPIVYPGDQNPYFDGGYNTAVHSSQSGGGPVDGLQIEANYDGVRDSAASRTNYALAVAQTLDYFFTNYYGLDLRLAAPCVWPGGAGKFATAGSWLAGVTPVSGNFLLFRGPGGAVSNNLAALTTGKGQIHSLLYDANAAGSYTNYGNPITLAAGVTNFSPWNQYLSNHLTLAGLQTFAAAGGPLNIRGNITNAGFQVTFFSATNLNVSGTISGPAGLSKVGPGTLTLSGASTFTGPSTNFSGVLAVNNSTGSANGRGSLYVASGATLAGAGTLSGPVTIAGSLAPGGVTGSLTVTNGLVFTGNGSYGWTLAAEATDSPGANFDQIVLSGGSLVMGSNCPLVIVFTNSATAPATNEVFWQQSHSWKIISLGPTATNIAASSFEVISNNEFAAGKFTSTADGAGNVLLNYFPTPPPMVASQPGAGPAHINLSWATAPGVTYKIEYATNLAPQNWLPLIQLTANGTNIAWPDTNFGGPQRFYRVVIP